jgi:hypothetical protein
MILYVDEARHVMKDAATLDFLETIFRHHRHHDLSKIILDQCAIKQFHKLDGMNEEIAEEFGMNHAQMRFVQNSIPGDEDTGYSQALLGVDGEWRGMEVHALPHERDVIENEADSQSVKAMGESTSAASDD